ncbi:MAG: hypothetical protein ACN6N1_09265 [Acinetobacter guillouiae]
MKNIYKYIILFVLILVIIIGYLVKKDLDKLDEDKNSFSQEKINDLPVHGSDFNEKEYQDIRKIRNLSNASLTGQEVENLNKTAKFLDFKHRVEQIIIHKRRIIEHKELNELMKELNRLREENYFFLGEAHAIKLELLKAHYDGDSLDKKIDELIAETKSIDANERSSYDPLNDPKFRAFKEEERRIVDQANTMTNFPNGLTKDEYIEQQIKRIY